MTAASFVPEGTQKPQTSFFNKDPSSHPKTPDSLKDSSSHSSSKHSSDDGNDKAEGSTLKDIA
jgi:hypothetical protein